MIFSSTFVGKYGFGHCDLNPPQSQLFAGCIDSLEVRKKPGGHWIIRDLMGLDLVGLASL